MNTCAITITTIPHNSQRYDTCGDWEFQNQNLVIRVSKLSDWRREMLIAIHELVEVVLCKHDGVTQAQVDAFDMKFEKNRKPGDQSEPGDHPKAPYGKQHCIASGIERILAAHLGVNWDQYADELEALKWNPKTPES